jgi:hypothetical protein
MADTVRGIIWIDAQGATRLTTPGGNATLASIQTAMLAKSRAVVAYYWEGARTAVGGTPSTGTYTSVTDAAILIFQAADCTQVKLTLPSPLDSIFMADGQTVDPAQITGITSACLGTLETAGGQVVTEYVAGYRARS